MAKRVAIITNVLDYAGPPAAMALATDFCVLCHSKYFTDDEAASIYSTQHPDRTVAKAQTPEDLVEEALSKFGRIDVAISNDAGDIRRGPIEDRSTDDFRALLESFAVAPFRLVAAVLPRMKEQREGRIILITSGAALRPTPQMTLYSAARAAANSMVRGLATEIGPAGLSINAIAPFYLQSNYFPSGMNDPELAKRIHELIPMKRFGQPEEIGALIELLSSGKADFISGQIIGFSGAGA
jgi:3-oxoacyl-[acyl-carrier protein] reductase